MEVETPTTARIRAIIAKLVRHEQQHQQQQDPPEEEQQQQPSSSSSSRHDNDDDNEAALVSELADMASREADGSALLALVDVLGPFLTSGGTDPLPRVKATALLCEVGGGEVLQPRGTLACRQLTTMMQHIQVLRRMDANILAPKQTKMLLEFFVSRYESDWESALACLRGVLALIKNQASGVFDGTPPAQEFAKSLLLRVFNAHIVVDLSQSLRSLVFDIAHCMITQHVACVVQTTTPTPDSNNGDDDAVNENAWFSNNMRSAIDGEKDPRCLLVCLAIVKTILRTPQLGGDSFVEDAFDLCSAYFPITFRPPPNDPFGITHEDLVDALNGVFCANKLMCACIIPMALERIKTTSTETLPARIEALRLVAAYCAAQPLDVAGMAPFLVDIRDTIVGLVLSPDEEQLSDEALRALKSVVRLIAPRAQVLSDDPVWEEFVLVTLRRCSMAMEASIDSMAAQGASKILVAMCDSCATGFATVLRGLVPLVESLLSKNREAPGKLIATLELIRRVVGCVDPKLGYGTGAGPIEPHAAFLFRAAEEQLELQVVSRAAQDWLASDESCRIVVLASLITRDVVCRANRLLIPVDDVVRASRLRVEAVLIPCLRYKMRLSRTDVIGTVLVSLRDMNGVCGGGDAATPAPPDVLVDIVLPKLFEEIQTALDSDFYDAVGGDLEEKIGIIVSAFPSLCEASSKAPQKQANRNVCVQIVRFLLAPDLLVKHEPGLVYSTLARIARVIKDTAILEECFLPRSLVDEHTSSDNGHALNSPQVASVVCEQCSPAANEKLVRYALARLQQTGELDPPTEAILLCSRRDYDFVLEPCLSVLLRVQSKSGGEEERSGRGSLPDSAIRVVCSVINKAPAGSVDAAVQRYILNGTLEQALEREEAAYTRLLGGVFKALALRGGSNPTTLALTDSIGLRLLAGLSSRGKEDSDENDANDAVAEAALHAFRNLITVDLADDGLNVPFARCLGVAKQRTYETWFRALAEAQSSSSSIRTSSGDADDGMMVVAALISLSASAPKRVMFEFAGDILPALLRVCSSSSSSKSSSTLSSLSSLSGRSASELRASCVALVKAFMEEDAERLSDHLATIVHFLLEVCGNGPMRAGEFTHRLDALGVLEHMTQALPYHKLHPFRHTITKRLAVGALDDEKRVVRRKAVECRERWLTFSA